MNHTATLTDTHNARNARRRVAAREARIDANLRREMNAETDAANADHRHDDLLNAEMRLERLYTEGAETAMDALMVDEVVIEEATGTGHETAVGIVARRFA